MTEDKQLVRDADVVRRENARVGYQAAVDLWTYEGEQSWARFNVMMVANSIVIAVIGVALTSQSPLPVLTVVLPIVGLVLCAVWFLIMKRSFDYQTYYVLSARELEEHYLADPVKTVSRGGSFADGKPVSVEINGNLRTLRMSRWSRIVRAQWASYIVVGVFVVVYIMTLLQI